MPTLNERMRRSGKRAHRASRMLIVPKLAAVLTNRDLYAHALACFWFVHTTLEGQLQAYKSKNKTGPVHDLLEVLLKCKRSMAAEEDLQYFLGVEWKKAIKPTPPVAKYVDHLRTLGKDAPHRLLAHAYRQYLAISGGGQRMKVMITKRLKLPTYHGTRFFDPADATPADIKNAFEGLLGPGGLTATQFEEVVQEGVTVFDLNEEVIRDFPAPWHAHLRAAPLILEVLPWYISAAAGLIVFGGVAALAWRLGRKVA